MNVGGLQLGTSGTSGDDVRRSGVSAAVIRTLNGHRPRAEFDPTDFAQLVSQNSSHLDLERIEPFVDVSTFFAAKCPQ